MNYAHNIYIQTASRPCSKLCRKIYFQTASRHVFTKKKARCTTIVEWQKETDHRPRNEESNQGCGLQGYRLLKHLNPLSRHDGRGLSSGAVVITPCIHNVG